MQEVAVVTVQRALVAEIVMAAATAATIIIATIIIAAAAAAATFQFMHWLFRKLEQK